MAHYAFLDENNIVTEVIAGVDENDLPEGVTDWEIFYGEMRGQVCKRTSYNTKQGIYREPGVNDPAADQSKAFRKNYAGIGYTYDEERDAFIPPKPYPSWLLDEDMCDWVPPVPMPEGFYVWDEDTVSWVEVTE